EFSNPRDGAVSRCDLVLDLSGGAPLFPAADLRDGYLRADPNDPAAVLQTVLKARDLTGTFDKPRYITFSDDFCAHSRSRIVGWPRLPDLGPAGCIPPRQQRRDNRGARRRGWRAMRARVSDRRRSLRDANRRCIDAAIARHAFDLS